MYIFLLIKHRIHVLHDTQSSCFYSAPDIDRNDHTVLIAHKQCFKNSGPGTDPILLFILLGRHFSKKPESLKSDRDDTTNRLTELDILK